MSKIAIDARESGTSTGRYIDKLIEHMHKLQPADEIVVITKQHRMDFVRAIAPNFNCVETTYDEFGFGEQLGFNKQLTGLGADLVHFGMVQQPVRYKGNVVTTMHDLTTVRFRNPSKNPIVFAIKLQVYKWVNKRVAQKSAAILTPTEYVKHDVASYTGVAADKITVTYEAADHIAEAAVPVPDIGSAPFIMYVGRPLPHKNLPRLIEAFKQLKQTHPDLKLVLSGKKDVLYDRIEKVATKQGIQDIIFTGFVGDAQLRWLYENCAAYVFPSLSEGFGLPGLEAMMHGAPVVSSNATCLPEVYADAAHYFDPVNIDDIAQRIAEVLDSPQLRQELIAKGTEQAKKYSWQRMAVQTLTLYKQILAKG